MKDDNIGYLLHRVSSAIDRHSNKVLNKGLNIGFSQFKILLVLSYQGEMSQNQIAQNLSQSEPSISRQIKLLNQDGLIETKLDANNKRIKRIILSRKGRLTVEKAIIALNNYYGPMFDRLSASEKREFIETLIKLKTFL